MSDHSKPYRALYGCEARSDWLTYIVNTIEAVSRQRLLQFEIANFQAHPSTAEGRRLFDTFVRGEERQIEDAREEMAGALQDIVDIGEDYVDSVRGLQTHQMPMITPTSAESGRHVPIIGPMIQAIILDMALRAPTPEERASFGVPTSPAQGSRPENFGADELRHLMGVQQRRRGTCGTQTEPPYQPRRSPAKTESDISDAAATKGSDSVEDEYSIEKIEIVPDEDVDYEAVSRQVDALLRLAPYAPLTPQQRQHWKMARQFDAIVTAVNESVLATRAGWKDDETRARAIESRLRAVLASLPLGITLDIGSFCNDLALIALREKEREQEQSEACITSSPAEGEYVPAEGQAGPSTGPGTLPHSNQEHQAHVEDDREDSPDPASIALPDSLPDSPPDSLPDSPYGSMSETGSEHRPIELE